MIQKQSVYCKKIDLLKKLNHEPNIVISVPSVKSTDQNNITNTEVYIYEFNRQENFADQAENSSSRKYLYKISGHIDSHLEN